MAKYELTEEEELLLAKFRDDGQEVKFVPIAFGSAEHEKLVSTAYGYDREGAEEVIAQYNNDFKSVNPDEVKRAKGLIKALDTKPTVTANWKRPLSDD